MGLPDIVDGNFRGYNVQGGVAGAVVVYDGGTQSWFELSTIKAYVEPEQAQKPVRIEPFTVISKSEVQADSVIFWALNDMLIPMYVGENELEGKALSFKWLKLYGKRLSTALTDLDGLALPTLDGSFIHVTAKSEGEKDIDLILRAINIIINLSKTPEFDFMSNDFEEHTPVLRINSEGSDPKKKVEQNSDELTFGREGKDTDKSFTEKLSEELKGSILTGSHKFDRVDTHERNGKNISLSLIFKHETTGTNIFVEYEWDKENGVFNVTVAPKTSLIRSEPSFMVGWMDSPMKIGEIVGGIPKLYGSYRELHKTARDKKKTEGDSLLEGKYAQMISMELALSAFRHQSFTPEKRARRELLDLQARLSGLENEVRELVKKKGFTFESVEEHFNSLVAKYIAMQKDYLSASSRFASSAITGGSGYNERTQRKRRDSMDKKQREAQAYLEAIPNKIMKPVRKKAVEQGGGELAIAKKRLAKEKKSLSDMVAINKIARSKKLSFEEKVDQVMDFGLREETARESMGYTKVYSTSLLTNTRAKIKGLENTIARLEIVESGSALSDDDKTFNYGEVTIFFDTEIDRIQMSFDEKPDGKMIKALKSRGFRYSPTKDVWQRKITRNTVYAINQIFDLEPKLPFLEDIK